MDIVGREGRSRKIDIVCFQSHFQGLRSLKYVNSPNVMLLYVKLAHLHEPHTQEQLSPTLNIPSHPLLNSVICSG